MRKLLLLIVSICALVSCREYKVSNDPSLRLTFSCDTLHFDTVFTAQGSATAQIMVYNRNKNALRINRIWLDDGTSFRVNVDGEADLSQLKDITLNGGDSLFVFVRTDIDTTKSNLPVLVTDRLRFHLANDATQEIHLEAYGQDVTRIGKPGCGRTSKIICTLSASKPTLIYDTLVVEGTLTIRPGATVYMHSGACIIALGNVNAVGTKDKPIVIRGDRLDHLFKDVPYLYAGGSWNGFYLQAETSRTWRFEYVDILSGNVGLYCAGFNEGALPQLTLNACRIHNHTLYGLVLVRTNAKVVNTEISNCASYCVYCAGGKHDFLHTTVASYFGNTDVRIQSAVNENTAAVYIDNLSKEKPATVTSFRNCIVTGMRANQLVVATPFDQYYTGSFIGNYLKTDSLAVPHAVNNTYWQKTDKAVFRNTYFKYKEYVYYDFHLDSLGPARCAGDSIAALPCPYDRDSVSRANVKPDAGCYQYQP